ncbi:MAG TPA: secondary thiamine-phosphate synthase enzyme YjbQ [Tepidisphaeraceae bacterium]|nr:secondary thiamine-phosphate synthase enzyme YjbQ [Tepidisphaeraceae bacterium]
MRTHKLKTETVETKTRVQMVDVTARIQKLISANRVESGLVVVVVPHTTAGITLQENADPNTQHDLIKKLESLVPQVESYYQHDEGNSDAHVKSALVGSSVTIVIDKGRLVLGKWQAVYFCEFDGPRERHLHVKIIDEGSGDLD